MTMLEIFKSSLKDFPVDLDIVSVKETNTKYKLTLKYGEDTDNVELSKTCTPGSENEVCWKAAATAMSSIYLNRGDLKKVRLWLDAQFDRSIVNKNNA